MRAVEVNLFIPCSVNHFFPKTGLNTIRLLEHFGCKVYYKENQKCCGLPFLHTGAFDDAMEFGVKFLEENASASYTVIPSGACLNMVRNNYRLFFDSSSHRNDFKNVRKKTFELSEFIFNVLKVEQLKGANFQGRAVYHDGCTALNFCQIKDAPRKLLRAIKGLELLEFKESSCCGFGANFSLCSGEASESIVGKKVEEALAMNADYIISTDYSCLGHYAEYIRKHQKTLKVMHIADVMAEALLIAQ
jgi:L-lactate dehydrogenase complex protein LldE